MKCGKCGAGIPAQSRYCLSCGEPAPTKTEKPSAEKSPLRKRSGLLIMIAALLLVAIIASLIALKSRGDRILSASGVGSLQAPILRAPASPGAPQPGLLQGNAPNAIPQPGLLQGNTPAPPPAKTGPPADVVAYLEHVKRVEQYRQSMRLDLSPAMDMLTKAYSLKTETDEENMNQTTKSIDKEYSDYTMKWQQIVAYFNSVPAPEGCRSLAGTYGDAISKYSSIMIKIQLSLDKKDISTLMALQGSAQNDVDNSLRKSDMELSSVCKTYGITKSFTVEPDKGMDSLLSTGL